MQVRTFRDERAGGIARRTPLSISTDRKENVVDSLFAAASGVGLGPLLAGPAMLCALSSLSFLRNF